MMKKYNLYRINKRMPPKTKFGKLLQQAKGRENPNNDKKKKKKKNFKPLEIAGVQRQITEEQKLLSFVERVKDLPVPELLQATEDFVTEPHSHKDKERRKKFFYGREGPVTLLPGKDYQAFLKAYLTETKGTVSLRKFWEDPDYNEAEKDLVSIVPYKTRPEIQEVIESNTQAGETKEQDEEKGLVDSLDTLSLEGKEIDEIRSTGTKRPAGTEKSLERAKKLLKIAIDGQRKQRRGGRVQWIDKDKKSVEQPAHNKRPKKRMNASVCASLMRRAPWVGRPNQGVFVYSIDGEQGYSNDKSSVIIKIDGEDRIMGRATPKIL